MILSGRKKEEGKSVTETLLDPFGKLLSYPVMGGGS